jgi:hypothetical protein
VRCTCIWRPHTSPRAAACSLPAGLNTRNAACDDAAARCLTVEDMRLPGGEHRSIFTSREPLLCEQQSGAPMLIAEGLFDIARLERALPFHLSLQTENTRLPVDMHVVVCGCHLSPRLLQSPEEAGCSVQSPNSTYTASRMRQPVCFLMQAEFVLVRACKRIHVRLYSNSYDKVTTSTREQRCSESLTC